MQLGRIIQIFMEAVWSELNLFEPFIKQTAVIGEMVQEFAPLSTHPGGTDRLSNGG